MPRGSHREGSSQTVNFDVAHYHGQHPLVDIVSPDLIVIGPGIFGPVEMLVFGKI